MYRYFTAANALRYEDVPQSLVREYNASRHRSIEMAPKDVTWKNERIVWKRLYGKRLKTKKKPKFKVGDRVRFNEKHCTFKKGYLPGWTEEVFVCIALFPIPYLLTKSMSWTTRLWKGRFTIMICRKCTCWTIRCSGSRRYLSGRKDKCWSSGKAGPTSTIVGSTPKP